MTTKGEIMNVPETQKQENPQTPSESEQPIVKWDRKASDTRTSELVRLLFGGASKLDLSHRIKSPATWQCKS